VYSVLTPLESLRMKAMREPSLDHCGSKSSSGAPRQQLDDDGLAAPDAESAARATSAAAKSFTTLECTPESFEFR
jgi:hypothetical protein